MDSAVQIDISSTPADIFSTDSKYFYDIDQKRIVVSEKKLIIPSKTEEFTFYGAMLRYPDRLIYFAIKHNDSNSLLAVGGLYDIGRINYIFL